jgi:hypothetical protein
MQKIIAFALTAAIVASASQSFAGTVDLMQAYWIGG